MARPPDLGSLVHDQLADLFERRGRRGLVECALSAINPLRNQVHPSRRRWLTLARLSLRGWLHNEADYEAVKAAQEKISRELRRLFEQDAASHAEFEVLTAHIKACLVVSDDDPVWRVKETLYALERLGWSTSELLEIVRRHAGRTPPAPPATSRPRSFAAAFASRRGA